MILYPVFYIPCLPQLTGRTAKRGKCSTRLSFWAFIFGIRGPKNFLNSLGYDLKLHIWIFLAFISDASVNWSPFFGSAQCSKICSKVQKVREITFYKTNLQKSAIWRYNALISPSHQQHVSTIPSFFQCSFGIFDFKNDKLIYTFPKKLQYLYYVSVHYYNQWIWAQYQ